MDYNSMLPGINPQTAALQNQIAGLLKSWEQVSAVANAGQRSTLPANAKAMEFVKGIQGARNYLKEMPKNSSAAVFDSEESVFYALSVDANGIPAPIKIGRFTLEDVPDETANTVTKKDIEDIHSEIQALAASIRPLVQNQQKDKPHNNANGRAEP